jgi:hypothetical protein
VDGGDTFLLYTGDNYDQLAAALDERDTCLAHERSEHTGNVILSTVTYGAFGTHHYVREIRAGDYLRLCQDGNVEEHVGEPC